MYGLNAHGQTQFNTAVTCAVISGLAVVIRISNKLWYKMGVHTDDYWIVIALALFWCNVAVLQWGTITGGGGIEMDELLALVAQGQGKAELIENYLKGIFTSIILYIATVSALKMSILYFYRRMFFITNTYQNVSLAVMLVTLAWFVASELVAIFACTPVDKFWHPTKHGKCANGSAVFLSTGIIDIIVDFAVLVMPIRVAFTLHLPLRTRIAMAGIFALGGFVIVTNIVRIQYIYQPKSRYVNFAQGELWSNIHIMTAFICACLPIYKPLWNTASKIATDLIRRYIGSTQNPLSFITRKSKDSSYIEMDNVGHRSGLVDSQV
ncbi:hypothetical protein K505DRAFT_356733 [Melanomma pulvis-pyrius CBS 109.77]|uniref:Rhodopsin domain-containing protein n=1 Tax=Melanomma pulvis-pyrius CBS 109.77 TaxID=1314802 RepID=A0A6A6XSP8_9PLEO|nr:hypothetical protein K505DRAFT_356733 [Melanomma pulvis-pyrius CBS 109.77]